MAVVMSVIMPMIMVAIGAAGMVVIMVVVMMIVSVVVVMMFMITIRAANMIRMVVIEEMRIIIQSALEVNGTAIQNLGQVNFCTLGTVDNRMRVDRADCGFHMCQFMCCYQISFVEQNHIGKSDLVFGFFTVFKAQR